MSPREEIRAWRYMLAGGSCSTAHKLLCARCRPHIDVRGQPERPSATRFFPRSGHRSREAFASERSKPAGTAQANSIMLFHVQTDSSGLPLQQVEIYESAGKISSVLRIISGSELYNAIILAQSNMQCLKSKLRYSLKRSPADDLCSLRLAYICLIP